jgi:DNA-directed RNA polymerase subunit RPC12/RpoP
MEQTDLTWEQKLMAIEMGMNMPISPESGGIKPDIGKESLQYQPLYIESNSGGNYGIDLHNLMSPPITPGENFRNQFNVSPQPQYMQPNQIHQLNQSMVEQEYNEMNYQLQMGGSPDLLYQPIPDNYQTQWADYQQPLLIPQQIPQQKRAMNPMSRVQNQMKQSGSGSSINSWSTNDLSFESQDWQQLIQLQNGQIQCSFPGCLKVFTKESNLKSHSRIHNIEKNYGCQACGACFRRSHDLKRHQRSLHSDVKPYGCGRCGKKFSRMVIFN